MKETQKKKVKKMLKGLNGMNLSIFFKNSRKYTKKEAVIKSFVCMGWRCEKWKV